ncbi:MAG: biopolymer transporter ExbD [Brevinematales bacterium]|nr:biopolymer transporter ExbD [Brevinematales bacterium]
MKLRKTFSHINIPVAAMSDIAFLLLIFLMVVSALDQSQKLKLNVPSVVYTSSISQDQVFTVFVDRDGFYYYKGEEKNLSEISFLYDKHASLFPEAILQVVGDVDTEYDAIDQLLNTLRKNGPIDAAFIAKTKAEKEAPDGH